LRSLGRLRFGITLVRHGLSGDATLGSPIRNLGGVVVRAVRKSYSQSLY
jgi:hypothetical protein